MASTCHAAYVERAITPGLRTVQGSGYATPQPVLEQAPENRRNSNENVGTAAERCQAEERSYPRDGNHDEEDSQHSQGEQCRSPISTQLTASRPERSRWYHKGDEKQPTKDGKGRQCTLRNQQCPCYIIAHLVQRELECEYIHHGTCQALCQCCGKDEMDECARQLPLLQEPFQCSSKNLTTLTVFSTSSMEEEHEHEWCHAARTQWVKEDSQVKTDARKAARLLYFLCLQFLCVVCIVPYRLHFQRFWPMTGFCQRRIVAAVGECTRLM